MSTTINFPEKAKQQLIKKFNTGAETDGLFSTDLDMEFSGVNTVHIYNLPTYPLQDYDKTKQVGTGSRYGETKEVGNEVQTFQMRMDQSLSLSIDKANKKDTFDMLEAGKVMENERELVITPALDQYRFQQWCENAGIHKELSGALSKANICDEIMALKREMLNKHVPRTGLVLCIKLSKLPLLILSDQWVRLENCGGKSLPSGAIGMFDGMAVKEVLDDTLPAVVDFVIMHKSAAIAPVKIKDFKGHVDPQGLSGQLLEFRMYYDAFVVGAKANGIGVAVQKGKLLAKPSISCPSGTATVTAGDSAEIVYTLDGSDPRYSDTAKVYGSTVPVPDGETIKAYARGGVGGKYASAVAEFTYHA